MQSHSPRFSDVKWSVLFAHAGLQHKILSLASLVLLLKHGGVFFFFPPSKLITKAGPEPTPGWQKGVAWIFHHTGRKTIASAAPSPRGLLVSLGVHKALWRSEGHSLTLGSLKQSRSRASAPILLSLNRIQLIGQIHTSTTAEARGRRSKECAHTPLPPYSQAPKGPPEAL